MEKKDLYRLLEGIDLKCELIIESLSRMSTDPDFLITSLRSIAEKQKKISENSSGKYHNKMMHAERYRQTQIQSNGYGYIR